MNLNQLTVFQEVMTSGSISQAARNLGRTQPAVSLALKGLEESLGIRLFVRQGRSLVPVPEAQYLLEEARDILRRVSDVGRTLDNLKARDTGRLNIAAMPGPSAFLFPRFVHDRIGAREDVRLTLLTGSSPQIVQLVSSQGIDFGFADYADTAGAEASYRADVIEGMCECAIPAGHPLAARKVIRAADLDGVPLGLLLRDHVLHLRLRAALDMAAVACQIRMECQNFLPIFPFVEAGRCLSVVDPLSAETYQAQTSDAGRIVFRPFEPALPYEYAIYTPAHRPLSLIATEVSAAWKAEILSILARRAG